MFDQFVPSTYLERIFAQVHNWDIERLWRAATRNIRSQNWTCAAAEILCLAYKYERLGLFEHQYEAIKAIVLLAPRFDSIELNNLHKLILLITETIVADYRSSEPDFAAHKDISMRYFLILSLLPSLFKDVSKLQRIEAYSKVIAIVGPECTTEDLGSLCKEAYGLVFTTDTVSLTSPFDPMERSNDVPEPCMEEAITPVTRCEEIISTIQQVVLIAGFVLLAILSNFWGHHPILAIPSLTVAFWLSATLLADRSQTIRNLSDSSKIISQLRRLPWDYRSGLVIRACQMIAIFGAWLIGMALSDTVPSIVGVFVWPGLILLSWILAVFVISPIVIRLINNRLFRHIEKVDKEQKVLRRTWT